MEPYTSRNYSLGRTTRMLRDAITMVKTGTQPVVIADVRLTIPWLKQRVHDLDGNPAKIDFIPIHSKYVEVHNMSIRAVGYSDEQTFIDHHAIAQIYGGIIDLYHRYN